MIEPESLSSVLILERIRNRIGVSGNSLIIIINRDMLVEKMLTWIDGADIITFPRVEFGTEQVIDIGVGINNDLERAKNVTLVQNACHSS